MAAGASSSADGRDGDSDRSSSVVAETEMEEVTSESEMEEVETSSEGEMEGVEIERERSVEV